jgi:glycosyltransferase involved in cell wall biosynthesis
MENNINNFERPNILHLSTHDFGGAGKAALRIHLSLLDFGINSKLIVNNKATESPEVYSTGSLDLTLKVKKVYEVLKRKLLFKEKYNMFSVSQSFDDKLLKKIDKLNFKPDVIILHWVANFVSLNTIQILHERYGCKIYWFAMDMAPLTGGCHYAWDCREYQNNCNTCPAISNFNIFNSPNSYFLQKKNVVKQLSINAIASNSWVAKQIESSSIPFENVDICYLPIDKEIFKPVDKVKVTNIVVNPLKIFFGTVNVNDIRKGAGYFFEALIKLKKLLETNDFIGPHPIIVLPGLKESEFDKTIPFEILRLPFAKTERELSLLYQASDVYVCSSIEDTGPLMVCEALMSGVPVIGFKMGVCPELIKAGYNGYLVELKDATQLASVLFNYIQKDVEERVEFSQNARESVESLMSYEVHTDKLLSIISNRTTD